VALAPLAGAAMGIRTDRGTVALAFDLPDQALRDARIALLAAREHGKHFFHVKALLLVGQARMRLGAFGPAERLLQAGLREARRRGIPTEEGEALNLLGVLALAKGQPLLAVERHSAALEMRRQQRAEPTVARYCNDLALALAACGDGRRAAELHSEALTISRRVSLPLEEGRALSGLASCVAASDPAAARRYRQQARDIFTAMGVPEQLEVERRLNSGLDQLRPGSNGGRMET
jgi:tetratricopeptide (TPR) repeat protein